MTLICGIDEAGKGPVIGDLVIGFVVIDDKDKPKLKQLNVRDSKLITPKRREKLFDEIKKIAKQYRIVKLSPQKIDEALSDPSMNLNKLEANTTANTLNELTKNQKIETVYIDCPSNNIKAYKDYIYSRLKKKINKIKLVVEHKADVKYLVVGAASILAKVTRDREIEKIKKKYGNCGSGYPSDPVCQEFVKENFEKYPGIFRKTWQTYKKLVKEKAQKKLSQF